MSERWVWDRYWQCDRIASCFDGAGATNYGDAVAEGWRVFFGGLPEGARILDLCTGNGAIALIAAEVSRAERKSFALSAVDLADIDPPAYVTRHRDDLAAVKFFGRTRIEALPFTNHSFDAAISQYGIEYSDAERSLKEAARVLAPGGQLRFVVHAAEGLIAANAVAAIAETELILKGIDCVGAARRCIQAVAKVERGDHSLPSRRCADAEVTNFRTALRLISKHVPHATDKVMLTNTGGVLLDAFQARSWAGYDAVLAKVDHVETEILAHRGRLQALLEAALSQNEAKALARRLGNLGAVTAACEHLENAEGLIGYVLSARFA